MQIFENHSLLPYNTFGIEAAAEYFTEIKSTEELKELIKSPVYGKLKKTIIGGGSNILFTKKRNGIVIKTGIKGIKQIKNTRDHVFIESQAGELWCDLVQFCLDENIGGIENLSLIPGLAGAAPIQNIGAYGVELSDVFDHLKAINLKTAETVTFSKADCNFGYRNSVFKNELKELFCVTSITLCLPKDHKVNIKFGEIERTIAQSGIKEITARAVSEAICHIRKSKLPDLEKTGNAGSFFKNPALEICRFYPLQKKHPEIVYFPGETGMVKISAGWLIEQCGWKGKQIGNTGVYEKHALTLINYGNATGKEVMGLAKKIMHSVNDKFGIMLEPEVNIF